jgi:hypothetical protein
MLITSNHALLDKAHLDRVALAWQRRALTVHSPGRNWVSLLQADQQLLAGLGLLHKLQQQSNGLDEQRLSEVFLLGELWALAILAMQQQHTATWNACVGLAQAIPRQRQALLSAAHWTDALSIQWAQLNWPSNQAPQAQADDGSWLRTIFGLCAAQQHDSVLQALLSSRMWKRINCDLGQAEPVLEAVLQLGTHVELPELASLASEVMLRAQQRQERFLKLLYMSSHVLMLLKKHQKSSATYTQAKLLMETVATQKNQPDLAWKASQVLASAEPAHFLKILDIQAQIPELRSVYIQGLGWCGRISAMPALMAALNEPQWAKMATASIMLITGSQPARDGWEGEAARSPSPTDTEGLIRPPAPLLSYPQPDALAFSRWWQEHRTKFGADETWLEGKALNVQSTQSQKQDVFGQILNTGQLHARDVVAHKLQWLQSGTVRLDTSWPGPAQLHWMQTHLLAPSTNSQRRPL